VKWAERHSVRFGSAQRPGHFGLGIGLGKIVVSASLNNNFSLIKPKV
jgi:hypothetical protein